MIKEQIQEQARRAKDASRRLAVASTDEKNAALMSMARALRENVPVLLEANRKDVEGAKARQDPAALVDRLTLNEKRIEAMAQGLEDTARLPDPVGRVLQTLERPNGLKIHRMSTPIGVIGIIYEARPNVTADCVGLCLKSGNAVILKGGKEAAFSNEAIYQVLTSALKTTALPAEAVQFVASADRAAVGVLLTLDQEVDLIVPRGGEGLIRFVAEHSRIPVVKHYKGVCHTYVSAHADLAQARRICFNAKVQRPGVCNAMETMLVHQAVAAEFLPGMVGELQAAGVEIRGCRETRNICPDVKPASDEDWTEEYLDLILAVRVVASLEEAVDHINTYGSHHSDAIVTEDGQEGQQFLNTVDSACVYVNASTRFTDGYEFGFGAEIGISTDKLHARGPMGLAELTTYKFMVYGSGQVRS